MSVADPLPIGKLLDEAVRVSRREFRALFVPIAIPVACSAAVMTALQVSLGLEGPEDGLGLPLARLVAFGIAVLVHVVAMMCAYAALQAGGLDAAEGRPIEAGRLWLTLARPRLLLTWLLAGLGIFLGILCCVLPGMYLGLLWAVVTAVVLREDVWGPDALRRSAELMRHNPAGGLGNHPMFHAFLLIFVGLLLSYAASFLVSIPLLAAMLVVGIRSATSGQAGDGSELLQSVMWIQVPTQFMSVLVQMAVQIFVSVGIAILYFELRRRREGDDLAAAVDSVGVARPQPPPLP
jgi:hypothetical protein